MYYDEIESNAEAAKLLNEIGNANIAGSLSENALQALLNDYFTSDPVVDDVLYSDESDADEISNIVDSLDNVPASERPNSDISKDDFKIPANPSVMDVVYMDDVHGDDLQHDQDDDDDTGEAAGIIKVNEAQAVMDLVGDIIMDGDKDAEMEKIVNFDCKCSAFKKGLCYKRLDHETVHNLRLCMTEMTDFERDLVIIGKVSATMNCSKMTECSKRVEQKERTRQRTSYFVEGKKICRRAFEYVHA